MNDERLEELRGMMNEVFERISPSVLAAIVVDLDPAGSPFPNPLDALIRACAFEAGAEELGSTVGMVDLVTERSRAHSHGETL